MGQATEANKGKKNERKNMWYTPSLVEEAARERGQPRVAPVLAPEEQRGHAELGQPDEQRLLQGVFARAAGVGFL